MESLVDTFEIAILLCLIVAVTGSCRLAAMLHFVLPSQFIELLTVCQSQPPQDVPDAEHCYGDLTTLPDQSCPRHHAFVT
jgi:hypothetical protein